MATSAEQLILRGLHLVLSSTFAPNDPVKQAAHYTRLTGDIGPWMADYVEEMKKPASEYRDLLVVNNEYEPTGNSEMDGKN